ncbi:MAG: TlpA family protein disulfide reductase [Gemmataceae bacterium]|nr:TlpA family protein disulfide reductase [Gemmataceae bacterium]
MRVLCAAVLTVSLGLVSASADDPKDPPKDAPKGDRAARVKELQAKFQEELGELGKKLRAAKTPAEQQGIRTEAKELATLTAGKAVALAEEDPKDPAALDAAVLALQALGQFRAGGPDADKAVKVLTDHHLGSPKVKDVVFMAGQMGPAGRKFLEAAADKAGDVGVKGTALYLLGDLTADEADEAAGDEKREAELVAKAVGYFERAAKEAPDVRLGRDPEPLSKKAAGEAAALKALGVGKPAPEVESTGLDEKKHKLSDYKGKVVLLDIWATWCGPCRAMIPHERELVKKLDGKPFVLLSVSADDDLATLKSFLEKESMPWAHWWDGQGGPVGKAYRVKAFPTMYLIGADGKVLKKWVGSPGNAVLDKAVEEAVAAAEKK